MTMNKEYIIVGDTKNYKGCLVYLAGNSLDLANQVLERMQNNPTDNDKRLMVGHTNLRVEEVKPEDCWWKDGFE